MWRREPRRFRVVALMPGETERRCFHISVHVFPGTLEILTIIPLDDNRTGAWFYVIFCHAPVLFHCRMPACPPYCILVFVLYELHVCFMHCMCAQSIECVLYVLHVCSMYFMCALCIACVLCAFYICCVNSMCDVYIA